MIIDGKEIALRKYEQIKKQVSDIKTPLTLLAILVGNNASSLRYIRQKKKWSEYVGINFVLDHLDENIEEKVLLEKIEKYNNDKNITGMIVQLPLPNHIDSKRVINLINPVKDIDGFNEKNQGKLLIGDDSGLIPCTPAGVIDIINDLKIDLRGKTVTVIGKSNIVGKPLTMLLINASATVISCNSKTKNLKQFTKISDIVICAVGKPGLLTLDMVNDKTVIIDVGFTVVDDKIYGDANFDNIDKNGNQITPVPGGVGPLTVANLMGNVIKSYNLNK
ncbi:bifunctional methylenetetrahydrofolate dehydrogenase/methenyltetrahydrofolate cyclohydrolase [Candidatus Gracilibacteria bacterium]|nr:bifunctional methylenetetrahydrofolate dehydrogenase/methenyltetrahydrofolate cyclohydrolase [Candidatus Gracilibacteria bacterium]